MSLATGTPLLSLVPAAQSAPFPCYICRFSPNTGRPVSQSDSWHFALVPELQEYNQEML